MTKEEIVKTLIELQCAYPLFYSNKTAKDFTAIANVWYKHVGKYDHRLVDKAVFLMIDNETEVPTIALVNRYIPKAREQLAWEAELADEALQEEIRRLSQ